MKQKKYNCYIIIDTINVKKWRKTFTETQYFHNEELVVSLTNALKIESTVIQL